MINCLAPVLLLNNETESVNMIDIIAMTIASSIQHPFPVSCSRFHPREQYLVSAGPSAQFQISDSRQQGQTVVNGGHNSNSMSCALNEDLIVISHDNNRTDLWDIRYLNEPIHRYQSLLSPVCNCEFSSDGQFLALAESDDFVSIHSLYQPHSTTNVPQCIDFIGETAGIAFCPTSNSFFIGIGGDFTLSGIVEFERTNHIERMYECYI